MNERELKRGDPALWAELGSRAFDALCWWRWWQRSSDAMREFLSETEEQTA